MSARILLVDDNYVQSATRRAILEVCGREVSIAPQGQRALELLEDEATAQGFGLVITDHLMPVMSGPEFVAELRRRGSKVPVLVLSAIPDAEQEYKGIPQVFVSRTTGGDELRSLVSRLVDVGQRQTA